MLMFRVSPKKWHNYYTSITSSNNYRFSTFFYCPNLKKKLVVTLSLKILPHLIYVATLPCEMSDIALKSTTTLTNCVINVDQAWPVTHKQLGLKSGRLCCLGSLSTDGLSTSTIHYNQPAEAGSRHCRSVWLIAPLVSGVAGLSSSSSNKADTLNIWWEKCKMWQLL